MRGSQGRENKMTETQYKHKTVCPCSGAKTKFINPDKCIFRRVFDNEMQQKFFCTHCAPSIIYDYPATVRFGDVPEAEKKELLPGALQVAALLEAMRSALAEWEPRKANHISDQLEEALDALERKAPESWLERKQ